MYGSKREMSGRQLLDELGTVQALVMFFSLTNSLAAFQIMMNNNFKELIDEGVVIIFMDDILIFGWTEEQHWVLYYESSTSSGSTAYTSRQRSALSKSLWSNTLVSSFWKDVLRWIQSKWPASKTCRHPRM